MNAHLPLINTPLQRGAAQMPAVLNCFNSLSRAAETVKTVAHRLISSITSLKRGVNEMPRRVRLPRNSDYPFGILSAFGI
jgi:hypothetical protein